MEEEEIMNYFEVLDNGFESISIKEYIKKGMKIIKEFGVNKIPIELLNKWKKIAIDYRKKNRLATGSH